MRFTCVSVSAVLVILLASTALGASALGAAKGSVYAHIEQFKWEESMGGGDLEESGPLMGLGGTLTIPLTDTGYQIEGKGEFFFGEVDYDGFVQNEFGEHVQDLSSETEYSGILIEGDVARVFTLQDETTVKPFAGFGFKAWTREIGSQYGYDEDWSTLYGILGVAGSKALNATVELFGSLALRYALSNKAEYSNVPLEGRRSAEVEPGEEASFYAEIGAHIQQIMCAVFYETM
ncbi:MAG: hypothetical protein JXB04_10965, partial [Kiritimatiellae bacterium]|nr:hypothetical protein [Kiritimatiellia bacterium]